MADDCIPIKIEQVRARIEVGPHYYVTTGTDDNAAGDIISFNINKQRGQATSTFSCQLEVKLNSGALESLVDVNNDLGHKVVIYAGIGTESSRGLPRLFTGYVISASQQPHWEDARKFILDLSGEDVFALMKYGPKFSRRFEMQDDPYAIITGGTRRSGGRMTKLDRFPGGAKKGTEMRQSSSLGDGDHSPLVTTPDPADRSPRGADPRNDTDAEDMTDDGPQVYRFNPSSFYANAGDVLFAQVMDEGGNPVNPVELDDRSECILCCNPPPISLSTGEASSAEGLKPDTETYPVKVKFVSGLFGAENGFEFTMTGDHPCTVTFIHPDDGGTCSIEFKQFPVHDHRNTARGGPAVATYDSPPV